MFNSFYLKLDRRPHIWEERITLFVGYLIQNNKKSTTVGSYVSSIKAVLLEEGIKVEEDKYLLSSLTRACRYKNDEVQTRLPIDKHIMTKLLATTRQYFREKGQLYLSHLYLAMFCAAYYGLLRVRELTNGTHPVRAADVEIATNKKKVKFTLHTSKTHWYDVKPQVVKYLTTEQLMAIVI